MRLPEGNPLVVPLGSLLHALPHVVVVHDKLHIGLPQLRQFHALLMQAQSAFVDAQHLFEVGLPTELLEVLKCHLLIRICAYAVFYW